MGKIDNQRCIVFVDFAIGGTQIGMFLFPAYWFSISLCYRLRVFRLLHERPCELLEKSHSKLHFTESIRIFTHDTHLHPPLADIIIKARFIYDRNGESTKSVGRASGLVYWEFLCLEQVHCCESAQNYGLFRRIRDGRVMFVGIALITDSDTPNVAAKISDGIELNEATIPTSSSDRDSFVLKMSKTWTSSLPALAK